MGIVELVIRRKKEYYENANKKDLYLNPFHCSLEFKKILQLLIPDNTSWESSNADDPSEINTGISGI